MPIIQCVTHIVSPSSRAIVKNQDLLPDTPWLDLFRDDFWGTPLTHSGSHKSYRPLCVASFRLNYYFHQLSPCGYHLVNVVLNALVTGLFTHFALVVLRRRLAALLAGLCFAAHPVHTEAVAGVVGRADVGCTLFFLLSLLLYVRYCRGRDQVSLRHRAAGVTSSIGGVTSPIGAGVTSLIGSVAMAGASLLWKEQGVTVIAVCAVFDVFVVCKLSPFHIHHIFTKVSVHGSLKKERV